MVDRNSRWLALGLLILSIGRPCAGAQRAIPDDNLGYPVRIDLSDCRVKGAAVQGSGFFFSTETEFYLVTARHVLFNVGEPPQPGGALSLLCKKAELTSYSRNPKEEQQNKFTLDLETLNSEGNVKAHSARDVAVVHIGMARRIEADQSKPSPYHIDYLSGVTVVAHAPSGTTSAGVGSLKKFEEVLTTNDIYVFGYPSSIGIRQAPQIDYSTPLVRKGIVAGVNRFNKTIVLDCLTFFGNSGGPVLQISQLGPLTEAKVIGIVSQYVPFTETWVNTTMNYSDVQVHNSGYSIAEPMDAVLELIGH